MPTPKPDSSIARSVAQSEWDTSPFRAAIMSAPPRLERSLRPAVAMTATDHWKESHAAYVAMDAQIAAMNAAGGPRAVSLRNGLNSITAPVVPSDEQTATPVIWPLRKWRVFSPKI